MDLKTQLETVAKNHQASIQNLKTKFDRLADKQSGRPSGSLPSNTQSNPQGRNSKAYQPLQDRNEHVNAIFIRSGQFLKELHTNNFSGLEHEDVNEHIEKVLEIVDLFHIPNITIDQVMLRAFPVSLTGAASHWLRNKPTGSISTWDEHDENLYQAWERFKELLMKCPQHYLIEIQETAADAKIAIQEMVEYSKKWHNGTSRLRSTETSDGLAAIQARLNNLGGEIKKVYEKVYAAQVGCEQCKGPHYTKDFPLKEEGKTLYESYYT
ncbi:hypothetical protein Tco_0058335 [Tanacetum coccineum]